MNTLYYGDNLGVLRRHLADESVDLVYLDPPFKSDQNYNGKPAQALRLLRFARLSFALARARFRLHRLGAERAVRILLVALARAAHVEILHRTCRQRDASWRRVIARMDATDAVAYTRTAFLISSASMLDILTQPVLSTSFNGGDAVVAGTLRPGSAFGVL